MQRLFTGHIHEFPFYKTYKFDVCEIESLGGKVPYHFDGEYAGKDLDYFKIETLPGKIKIRTPRALLKSEARNPKSQTN